MQNTLGYKNTLGLGANLLFSELAETAALRLLLLHHQGFDDVVDLEVIEVLQAHTTLVALQDFLGIFLEALQRGDAGVGIHDDGIADDTSLGATDDLAILDQTAGDCADTGDLEHILDARATLNDLFEDRLGQPGDHFVDGIAQFEDEIVGADLNLLGCSDLERFGQRDDVEANDDGIAGGCQQDVGLRDTTGALVQDLERNGLGLDLPQLELDGVQRGECVGLQDESEFLLVQRLFFVEQLVQRQRLLLFLRQERKALLLPFLVDDQTARVHVFHHMEDLARLGQLRQTHDLDGHERLRFAQVRACLVGHALDLAHTVANADVVTDMECSSLHEQTSQDADVLVDACLDDGARRFDGGPGLESRHLRLQEDHVQEFVYTLAGLGRHGKEDRVSTPVVGLRHRGTRRQE